MLIAGNGTDGFGDISDPGMTNAFPKDQSRVLAGINQPTVLCNFVSLLLVPALTLE